MRRSVARPASTGIWLRLAIALALGACGFAACTTTGSSNLDQGGVCEPGSDIFCRCPSGEPGTRRCLDGQTFDVCVIGPDTPCPVRNPTGSGQGGGTAQNCEPGETVFCTCDGGQTGTKSCLKDGSDFSACMCAPPMGAGGGGTGAGGSGGGTTAGLPLYSPCSSPKDCDSGVCEMGYCTKSCAAFSDCTFGVAECVTIGGNSSCRPTCSQQIDCAPYLLPSECGYTQAIDSFPVTVCADWFNALQLPPIDYACTLDTDCNLGHQGRERVCHATQNQCKAGCHVDADCPAGETCATNTEPGVCSILI